MVNKISFAIWKRSGYLEQVRITNDFQKTAVMELFKFIRQMSSTAQAVVPEKKQSRSLPNLQIQAMSKTNSYQTHNQNTVMYSN